MSRRKAAPVIVTYDATIARYAALATDAVAAGQHEEAQRWRERIAERVQLAREKEKVESRG